MQKCIFPFSSALQIKGFNLFIYIINMIQVFSSKPIFTNTKTVPYHTRKSPKIFNKICRWL